MTTRIQPRCWLLAAAMFSTLCLAPRVYAADPPREAVALAAADASAPALAAPDVPAPASSTSPKADDTVVKLPERKDSFSLSVPARLQLAPLKQLPPLHMPKDKHHVVRIWGLTIPTFVAYGLSSVSAGGAVFTGIAASRSNDPKFCDSGCKETAVHQKALLVTTGVLTGLAVAGLTVGVVFMVKDETHPERNNPRPRLDLGISGDKAVAKIGWVFSSL
jgi:hypothetical protein